MTGAVIDKDLFAYALMRPLFSSSKPNTLRIVSGYATHAMASRHLLAASAQKKSLAVDLIYGMAGTDGVRKSDHLGFISLERKDEFKYNGEFACSYVRKPKAVHSKVYVWCKDDRPVQAFIGSANYSEAGFNSVNRTETLTECDPLSAFEFFQQTKELAVPCARANREKDFFPKLRAYETLAKGVQSLMIETDENSPYKGCLKIVIPLVNNRGHLGDGSGLNWGVHSDGTPRLSNKKSPNSYRDPNEAYIRVPKKIALTGFFPAYNAQAKGKDEQTRFTVITDDGETFSCVRTSGGFGKEIETPQDNSELGRYFRKRLGLPSGAYIDVKALKRYGRLDVTFYKTQDESYVMDFSRPTR